MFCFINLTPQTPPSVIHGWKATDLLYEMVKTKKIFFHPVKRQIFDDAPKQTFYMISKLVVYTWIFSSWTLSLSLSVCLCHLHLPNIIKVPTNQRQQNEFRSIWNMAEFCNNEERLKLGLRLFIHFHQISRQNCLSLIM